MVRMWDTLKLDPTLAQRQLDVGADFVLALAATRCSEATHQRLQAYLAILRRPGPTISGAAVASLPGVPPHLRGLLIAQLHVLCRLRGDVVALETADQLTSYLTTDCEQLLDRLRDEWWLDGQWQPAGSKPMLRAAYTKELSNAWLRAGVMVLD